MLEIFYSKLAFENKKKYRILGVWNQLIDWEKYFTENRQVTRLILIIDNMTIACDNLQAFNETVSKFRYSCIEDMNLDFNK